MAEIPVQDKRGYFILPQRFEGGGYYVYGKPTQGRGQYAHPKMILLLQAIACDLCHLDSRKFGVGNISTRLDAQYDRLATAKLIELFVRHPSVKRVLFPDSTIPGVRPAAGHDNHFHAELRKVQPC